MLQLTGMAVTLNTSSSDDSGTPNHIYIGVVGKGGGREFALDSPKDDFKTGQQEKFALGFIFEGGVIDSTTKFPKQSDVGKNNDPAFYPLDMDRVDYVYLRKQGNLTKDSDDAYKLKDVKVVLYGPSAPSKKIFVSANTNPLWIANEHGHVVYLQETREG
jgi:hypothetical protein